MKQIFLSIVFLLALGSLGFYLDDNSLDQALADEIQQAQKDEGWKARRVAKQISDCVQDRGPGAAPVFDESGFVVECKKRRKP